MFSSIRPFLLSSIAFPSISFSIISSVTIGPLISPSPSLSMRSTLLPGVSINDVAATPTGSVPKAGFPIPSLSIDHATSLIILKSGVSSPESPSPPTRSASHSEKATLS